MAFDNLVLERIVAETGEALRGAFFDAPYALGVNQYALPFHGGEGGGGRGTLILFLDPNKPFVTYSRGKFTKTGDTTPFFNSLRKLSGNRILSISKEKGERVVTIKTEIPHPAFGELNTAFDLVVELFPSRPNAYLIAYPYGKIVSLFKERGDILSKRYLTRNVPYTYPPERTAFDRNTPSLEASKPLLSYEVFRKLSDLSSKVGFQRAKEEVLSSPCLYYERGNVYPCRFDMEQAKPVKAEEIYACFVEDQRSLAKALREKELVEKLQKAIKVTQKKIKNLDEDYALSFRHLEDKDFGNLLFLHQTEYVPGSSNMNCDGVAIPLDPKKGVIENANAYFKRYRKAKQAVITLKELKSRAGDELTYLQKKLQEVPLAGNRDLQELKEELVYEGYLKDPSRGKKKMVRKKSYVPHVLILESGARIAFGMNDLQNETLTFQVANPRDLFFHVKDYPGAHVAILDGGRDDEAKRTAAELALYLSHLESGDVMVAERRYVKRNPNRTGLVNILRYETIHLREIRPSSLSRFKEEIGG